MYPLAMMENICVPRDAGHHYWRSRVEDVKLSKLLTPLLMPFSRMAKRITVHALAPQDFSEPILVMAHFIQIVGERWRVRKCGEGRYLVLL